MRMNEEANPICVPNLGIFTSYIHTYTEHRSILI